MIMKLLLADEGRKKEERKQTCGWDVQPKLTDRKIVNLQWEWLQKNELTNGSSKSESQELLFVTCQIFSPLKRKGTSISFVF